MRYRALISDYDGTLAEDGKVSASLLHDLKEVKTSGRKLVLLTGRELPDLLSIFPEISLFDRVVAENGALLYRPETQEAKPLAEAIPEVFFQTLFKRNVFPLSRGQVLVSTREPYETIVLEVIRDLGLELAVIFNKGAVMVLPSGINKKTGLDAALGELGLAAKESVGVGDAENDHAFLEACGYSVAVAGALPMLKLKVDHTVTRDSGEGVRELIKELLGSDLNAWPKAVR